MSLYQLSVVYMLRLSNICCVFRTANGCSACCLLVEIISLALKQPFPLIYGVQKTPQITKNILFCSVSDIKSCFSVKKLISTSQWHAEHPFAGQNTQHTFFT